MNLSKRWLLCTSLTLLLSACYSPDGPIPEAKKEKAQPLWSN